MELDLIDSFAPQTGETVTYTYRSRAGVPSNVVVDSQDDEYMLYLPSQTNCAMACQFKMTRLAGKIRALDLRSEEIVNASENALRFGRLGVRTRLEEATAGVVHRLRRAACEP
jgi:adenine C2-methylase RlmN of 23S rRNA A2503 and tRNA A37